MVPYLAQPKAFMKAYRYVHFITHTVTHTRTHTHICTHTKNTWKTGDRLVERMTTEKMTNQHAEEKRWVFSFDLREWWRMPDWERKRVPDYRSEVLKGFLPQGPPAHPRNAEDLSIWLYEAEWKEWAGK